MSFVCEKGAKVGGRYELRRLLGEGGMGEVWAGVHLVTRRPVALKFLKGDAGKDSRHRFIREARAASVIHHPNVVPMIDILELDDGAPVLVMDLLEGATLADVLAQRGCLQLAEASQILIPMISAVGSAHALGIVHRDLKPANIFLIEREEGGPDVRVLDFGVAKFTAKTGDAAETAHLTQTGEVLGTPYYMPPEQVFGENDIDHRADIWSIGVILYECLAGCRPFEGPNAGQILKKIMMGNVRTLQELAPRVPDAVSNLVGRMLSLEREKRPSDLREVMEILRLFSDVHVQSFGTAQFTRPDTARIDPYSETTFAPASKRRWPLIGAAVGVLCAAVGIGVMWKLRAVPEIAPRNVVVAPPPALAQPQPVAPPPVAPPPVAPPVATPQAPPPVEAAKPSRPHHAAKKPQQQQAPAAQSEAKKKLPGGVVDEVPF